MAGRVKQKIKHPELFQPQSTDGHDHSSLTFEITGVISITTNYPTYPHGCASGITIDLFGTVRPYTSSVIKMEARDPDEEDEMEDEYLIDDEDEDEDLNDDEPEEHGKDERDEDEDSGLLFDEEEEEEDDDEELPGFLEDDEDDGDELADFDDEDYPFDIDEEGDQDDDED